MRPRPSIFILLLSFVLALPIFVLAAPMPAAAAVFNPETFTLSNGLQVVLVENHRAPIVTQMVWYKAGAADARPGKSGVAHYLEHLMFKGTKTLAPGTFSKLVAENGGRENAFTSQDYTAYHQTVARDRLELVMRLEADRMANLVIVEDQARPELDVVLEERRARTDNNPMAQLGELARAVLFLNHPYGTPVIGWAYETSRLTAQDARDFYGRYYAPNNAVLVVAGDVTMAELRPLAEKYYGVIPARPVPARIRPSGPDRDVARRLLMRDARAGRPRLLRYYLAPSYLAGETKYADPLQVLAELFGQGPTSRLYRSLVVEQKLAVGAGAFYDAGDMDRTSFTLSASPRPGVAAADLETALDAEIERLLTDGVGEDEVARAQERLAAAAIYARDSLTTGARVLGAALAVGRTVEDVETWPDRIAAVTAAEVTAAARAVLRRDRSLTATLLPEGDDSP